MSTTPNPAPNGNDVFHPPFDPRNPGDAPSDRVEDMTTGQIHTEFTEMTRGMALPSDELRPRFIGGEAVANAAVVETAPGHPDAVELLRVGAEIKNKREGRYQELVDDVSDPRTFLRVVQDFFSNRPPQPRVPRWSRQEILNDLADKESKIGQGMYRGNTSVGTRRFFFLPEGHQQGIAPAQHPGAANGEPYDEWIFEQISPIKTENFTNSYIITPSEIKKSSSHYSIEEGRYVNDLVVPDQEEIQTLMKAVHMYRQNIDAFYAQPVAPRHKAR